MKVRDARYALESVSVIRPRRIPRHCGPTGTGLRMRIREHARSEFQTNNEKGNVFEKEEAISFARDDTHPIAVPVFIGASSD